MTNAVSDILLIRRTPWPVYTLGQLTVTNLGFYATMSVLAVHLAQVLNFLPAQVTMVLLASSSGCGFRASWSRR